MRIKNKVLFWSLVMLSLLQAPVFGQFVTARLTGTVKDATGAIVPGVTITAQSVDTGRTWETLSLDTGDYNFNSLPVGRYSVSAELAGFKIAVFNAVILEVNQVARLDITLEIGELSQTVEVRGQSPVLQSDTSSVGTVVSSTTTQALPLNGRNYIQQTLLVPGVVAINPSSFTNGARTGGGGRPWVNGNRQQANNFQLDGIDNNQTTDNMVSYQPNVDAIQESKIITNNAPAEFGNFQGGIINVTLKSGTNDFHGNIFEFHRNESLNASSWQANYLGVPKTGLAHNVFGGTFGGPIVKNKIFFFGDYQGTRRRPAFGGGAVNLIPEAFRKGDFSSLSQQLYNPFTTRKDPQTGQIIRDPFPGNKIPENLITPVAKALFAMPDVYPLPTRAGLTQNYITSRRQTLDNDQWDVRVDAKLTDKDDLFVRYSDGLQEIINVDTTPILGGNTDRSPFNAAAVSWTRTLSPTLMNEFRVGVNRIGIYSVTGEGIGDLGNLGESLGISGVNQRGPGLPALRFSGAATDIGNPRGVKDFWGNTIQIGDNVSITRGRHLLKTGIQILRYQQNNLFSGNNGQLGFFTFNGQYSRDLSKAGSLGNPIADFLLGFPSQMGRGIVSGSWGQRSTLWAGFIQDDWRAAPNLTFNLGLRYEYTSPLYEVRDRQSNFDLVTGKQLFAGKDGNSRGLYEGYKRNFQPRVGFAWSFADKTVLRGAYTISGFMEGTGLNLRLPLNPPFEVEFERINTDPAVLGTPLTEGYGDLGAKDPFKGATLRAWSQKVRPAMVQQWNLTLERQFASDLTVSAGYVGQHGTHLITPVDHNQKRLGESSRPFDAFWPQIGFVVLTDSVANQRYDALQVAARKRYGHGLEFLGSYTWSHAMSDASGFYLDFGRAVNSFVYWANRYDQKAEWGPAASDLRHNLTFSYLYELPFGKGRMLMSSAHPAVEAILGGWSLSGIVQVQSGFPITPWAVDQSLTGGRLGRPDRIADGKGPQQVGRGGFWFDPNAFAVAKRGTFGNAGTGILRGPGMAYTDLGLVKRIHLDESKFFEVRGEFFNLTNSPIFGAPEFFFPSPNFGKVLSAQGAREIQLGLKFHF